MTDGLSLEKAVAVIDAALATAREQGTRPLSVAVLDDAGRLLAFKRQAGAPPLSPDIAQAKAYTAVAMGVSSRVFAERAVANAAFVTSLAAITGGRVIPSAGGLAICDAEGRRLGAVGASGDVPDKDEAAAKAGLEANGYVAG